jgi:hypothetical protein
MFINCIIILIISILILFVPDLLQYYSGDVDFFKLLSDHKEARYPLGIALLILGIILLIICYKRKKGRILLRQVSSNIVGEGLNKLCFSPFANFFSTETIELGSSPSQIDHYQMPNEIRDHIVEMRYMTSKINFTSLGYLGADYIPYIVELGVLCKHNGKISLYHNFISEGSSKVRKLTHLCFGKQTTINEQTKKATTGTEHEEVVLAIAISHEFDEKSLPTDLSKMDRVCLSTTKLGRNAISNMREAEKITRRIVDEISNLGSYKTIHLLLCCSSELCFNIGRNLRIGELPKIRVYDYNKSNSNNTRPWYVELTN